MNFKNIVVFSTLIALHFALFKYSSSLFPNSQLNYYINVVKSALANKTVQVSVNDIDIQQSITNPNNLVVTLLVSEKNIGDSAAAPANFSLATQNGLAGARQIYNDRIWQPLDSVELAPGQQKEGAVFFEIPKSDQYTFTYSRGYQSTQYKIPSEKGLFIPFVINPV